MSYTKSFFVAHTILLTSLFSTAYAQPITTIPCSFDATKNCTIERDILNDKSSTGLYYHAATNYDHRMSGEIEVYNSTLVQSYQDSTNTPGQIKFLLSKSSAGAFTSGEIMTRANLTAAPFYAKTPSLPWTTKEISHGYLEIVVKMPKCDTSSDGLCQSGKNPQTYDIGLWPAIWLMPSNDANWPMNGEIDLAEAYPLNSGYSTSTATLHFNGNASTCTNGDCVGSGYHLAYGITSTPLYAAFHTWGFEWQPDPASTDNGYIMTGYLDGVKTWGPLQTDSLPADGKNALSRGFNDATNGGYYLILNLAVGGPYAGAPNANLQTSNMYVQSAKAYTVSTPTCIAPANIQSMVSPDKTQLTIAWEAPANSATVVNYKVNNWQNEPLWTGTSPTQRAFQDQTLPGTSGTYNYYLYTVCNGSTSAAEEYSAVVSLVGNKAIIQKIIKK
jgi:hypothetical protein